MIKRRFYRLEHADGDGAADSSSSSSDSELEEHATESESEDNNDDDDNVAVEESNQVDEASSTSSGYESEDSSADEINVDSKGVVCGGGGDDDDEEEEEEEIENDKEMFVGSRVSGKHTIDVKKSSFGGGKLSVPMPSDVPDCIFKIKSVFRCRICPRIVCLTEETMRAHLKSKRHARSEKLMRENRLKAILNNDGQIENQETAAEMHARIVALAENNKKTKKTNRRQRRRKMSGKKEKVVEDSVTKKSKEETRKPAKKKRKSEN